MNWFRENKSQTISLIVSIFYLIVAFHFSLEIWFKMLIFLFFPLVCIFFSEEMGNYTGFSGQIGQQIDQKSPGVLILILGWILLFLPVVMSLIAVISRR